MPTRQQVREAHIDLIAKLASKAFARHIITPRYRSPCGQFASWRCQRPKTSSYFFDVTVEPGRLLVMGDIGFCAWRNGAPMLAWARRAIKNIDYFASKVVGEVPVKEWTEEVAGAWLEEQTAEVASAGDGELTAQWDCLKHELEIALADGQAFFDMTLYASGWVDSCDWPDLRDWKPGFLWAREAARWFLANYTESET